MQKNHTFIKHLCNLIGINWKVGTESRDFGDGFAFSVSTQNAFLFQGEQ